jgi:hypothetical protein
MITAVGWIICAIFPPSSIKPRRILVSATATPKKVLLPIRSSGGFSVLHGGGPLGRDYDKDYGGEVKVESNCQIFLLAQFVQLPSRLECTEWEPIRIGRSALE